MDRLILRPVHRAGQYLPVPSRRICIKRNSNLPSLNTCSLLEFRCHIIAHYLTIQIINNLHCSQMKSKCSDYNGMFEIYIDIYVYIYIYVHIYIGFAPAAPKPALCRSLTCCDCQGLGLVARNEASILAFHTKQILYWSVLGQIQFCSFDRRCKTCLNTKPVL